jgi:hypothetical protein
MTQRIDTADTIRMLARGEATFTLLGEPDPQVAFLIRERSAVITYLGETAVEARSGLFPVGQIAVTAVIFRVGQYVMQEYVTWWNYHQAGNAEASGQWPFRSFCLFIFMATASGERGPLLQQIRSGNFLPRPSTPS